MRSHCLMSPFLLGLLSISLVWGNQGMGRSQIKMRNRKKTKARSRSRDRGISSRLGLEIIGLGDCGQNHSRNKKSTWDQTSMWPQW